MSIKAIEAEVSIQSGINGAVSIASGLVEAETQIGREIIKTVYEEPVLEPLSVTANGTYEPEEGIDGYSDVTVNVPGKIPVLEQLKAIANGEYYPAEGVDGFDEVLVDVPMNIPDAYVCEGTFKATETGILNIDTEYDGAGYPKIIVFHQTTDLDDSNLSDFENQSFMAIAAVKCYPQEPTYAETKNLDSYMLNLAYRYGTSSTRFTQTTGYVLSQNEPTYTVGKAFKMPDSRTLKIWAGDRYTGEGGYFMIGVTYKYRIIYTEPNGSVEPQQDPNVIEGEFIGTETGVLTIDLPYTGDSYPKAIMIYDSDGIIKADVPMAYTISAYSAVKNNAQEPNYDGDTANNTFRYQDVYTGKVTYTSGGGQSTYIFSQAEPVMGANSVKMPDSKTLKVYVTDATVSSAIRFRTGISYKYKVFY